MAVTGSAVVTGTPAGIPNVTTYNVGIGSQQWNGTIASMQEYNGVAFTDAELLAAVVL